MIKIKGVIIELQAGLNMNSVTDKLEKLKELCEANEAAEKILREDSFCYHTKIKENGKVIKTLRNGIEEEFYKELLSFYNEGKDFGIVFFDEIEKEDKIKKFIPVENVAIKLAETSKNVKNPESYLADVEEFFLNGIQDSLTNKEIESALATKTKNRRKL